MTLNEVESTKFYYLLQTISIIIMKGERFFSFKKLWELKNEATI